MSMTTNNPLIDHNFDSSQLTNLSLGETIIGALSMPDYYRADTQTPLFSWIILTNKQLILLGRPDSKYFKLNSALKISRNKNREGITIIVLKSSWKQCIIRGCFGSCEDQLIKILQAATRIAFERDKLPAKGKLPAIPMHLVVAALLMLVGLVGVWVSIVRLL